MSVIINPGSGPIRDDINNSYEVARSEAQRWLTNIHAEGWPEVELTEPDDRSLTESGRWTFTYTHTVTGMQATLEQHGVTEAEQERHRLIFGIRVYWNGAGHSSNPSVGDWLPQGWSWRYEYEPAS